MPLALTDDGLQTQTVDEIRTELHNALRDPVIGFGPDFVLDEHEAIPMVTGILAFREARVQALARAVLDAGVPGSARGVHEDNLAAITGTVRREATFSSVAAELHGTALALIPSGRIVRHNPTQTLWSTIAAVNLDGAGDGPATLRAQDSGPIEIVASTDWSIVTGDANLTSVESTGDSTPGRLVETDVQLEERRVDELATLGTGTVDAIAANLQQDVEGLTVAAVFANTSHVVDADGLEPDSIEILVDDGGLIDNEVIARAIFANITAGTRTQGNVQVDFVDARGQDRTIFFSRATQLPVWLRFTLTTTGAEVDLGDEAGVTAAIQAAADEKGDALRIGRDVVPAAFTPVVWSTVPENSLTDLLVERSTDGSSWSASVLTIPARTRATFAEARIVVVVI